MRKRIESPKNPEVKGLVRLKERRVREREGRFLIEGERETRRAWEAEVPLRTLYVCLDFMRPEGHALAAELENAGVDAVELSKEAFSRVSYRDAPDGVLAVARVQPRELEGLELSQHALVLVLDGLEKPGNLGALLRTADGAGLDAVFLTGEGTDLTNPNVIRASMGSVFARPVRTVAAPALLEWLAERGFNLVAASPGAEVSFWDADYRGATAIVLGTEHEGLSPLWLEAAHTRVAIPMHGLADSLNVATAGALLVYEALRQRRP